MISAETAFVEMKREEDCEYCVKILNMIKVFGKPIRVNKASQDGGKGGGDVGVGANVFVGAGEGTDDGGLVGTPVGI